MSLVVAYESATTPYDRFKPSLKTEMDYAALERLFGDAFQSEDDDEEGCWVEYDAASLTERWEEIQAEPNTDKLTGDFRQEIVELLAEIAEKEKLTGELFAFSVTW